MSTLDRQRVVYSEVYQLPGKTWGPSKIRETFVSFQLHGCAAANPKRDGKTNQIEVVPCQRKESGPAETKLKDHSQSFPYPRAAEQSIEVILKYDLLPVQFQLYSH